MTANQVWLIVGLSLGLVGSFLVSVEAVKLDNLRKLDEIVRNKIQPGLKSPPFYNPAAPPDDVRQTIDYATKSGLYGRHRLYFWIHVGLGVALLAGCWLIVHLVLHLNMVSLAVNLVLATPWWGVLIAAPFAIWAGAAAVWFLGEFAVHGVLDGGLSLLLKLLGLLDRNTPRGTTGVLGFSVLFVSFVCQIVGTLL